MQSHRSTFRSLHLVAVLLAGSCAGAVHADTAAPATPLTTAPAPAPSPAPVAFHPEAICRTLCENHSIAMDAKLGPLHSLEGESWELADGHATREPFHRFAAHAMITGTDTLKRHCWFAVQQYGAPAGNLGLGARGVATLDVRLEAGDPARAEDAVLVAIGRTNFWQIDYLDDRGLIETIDDGHVHKTVSTFETGRIDRTLTQGSFIQHVTGPVRVSVYTEPNGVRRAMVRVHYEVQPLAVDPAK